MHGVVNSTFIRALPPDPLNQYSEGAWHSLGQDANGKKYQMKKRIDSAIKAAVTLDMHEMVCKVVGCKFHEEERNGVWQVGARSPEDAEWEDVCGGLICGPFYHGMQCGLPLPICHQCHTLAGIKRPLCDFCSYDDGNLPLGYTLCLKNHCPALAQKHSGSDWHSGYYQQPSSKARIFMYECGDVPLTTDERIAYMRRKHPELTNKYFWRYRELLRNSG